MIWEKLFNGTTHTYIGPFNCQVCQIKTDNQRIFWYGRKRDKGKLRRKPIYRVCVPCSKKENLDECLTLLLSIKNL